jgi:hypothetical protein
LSFFHGRTLPILQGEGTSYRPYLITNPEELGIIVYRPHECYQLVNDINCSGITWSGAIIPNFYGTLQGNGFTIKNLIIRGHRRLGFIGTLRRNARVMNLGIVDANLSADGYEAGFLAGRNSGFINQCYCSGFIKGSDSVGGLVGINGVTGSGRGTLINCYSTSTVSGDQKVGGLVGWNYNGDVLNSYSIGEVNYVENPQGSTWESNTRIGGLVGYNMAKVNNCFWDIETSKQSSGLSGLGLTTSQMKDINLYLNAGWDFLGESENGLHEVWRMTEGSNYPVLSLNHGYTRSDLIGTGSKTNPYQISTPTDLGSVIYYESGASYKLINDINLSRIQWSYSIIPELSGQFDGNGHIIQGLSVSGLSYVGLIGTVSINGQVKNLKILDAYINGIQANIGILAGSNYGQINQCSVSGTVNGHDYVGGLVGYHYSGIISNSYSIGSVSGHYYVGGLVGYNFDTVLQSYSTASINGRYYYIGGLVGYNNNNLTNSYSTGLVSGTNYVGGLVGLNYLGTISNSYSTGSVNGIEEYIGGFAGRNSYGDITNSFWDTEISEQSKNADGSGITTLEMQTSQTFLDADWDFNDIWMICEGKDYPHLQWEQVQCE